MRQYHTPGSVRGRSGNWPFYLDSLGIDGRQISRYENDKVTPSVDVVIKLARAFDVSVDHLLIDDVPRRPLREPISKLAEKVLHLENISEEDEASLLHVLSAIEAKNKLKTLMRDIQ